MTQAIATRRNGDEFQARWFWKKAARLLDDEGNISRVTFESGPRGFDDIAIEYKSLKDHYGLPLHREHIQCKWHVAPGVYGYEELVDPAFINASANSFLQRALAAQKSHAPDGEGARFKLVTNWRVNHQNPLNTLVHNRTQSLRLDRLFDGGKASATGKIRQLWCEHLGLTEEELRILARTLALSETTDSLDALREELDTLFRVAGLRRIPPHESAFIYDDVVFKWLGQGRTSFDKETLKALCTEEGLIGGNGEKRPLIYGVKSFEHPTDLLEDRCTEVLNLVPNFSTRQIRPDSDWSTQLYPALRAFLHGAAKESERLRLILDTHLTLSFAAGSVLDIKSGRIIEIEQRAIGKAIWTSDDKAIDPSWPTWSFEEVNVENGAPDLVVAIGLTHDIAADVMAHVRKELPNVGHILIARPNIDAGPKSVVCGHHAFNLVDALATKIRSVHAQPGKHRHVHVFAACPGGFAFFLGQRHVAIGPLTLYEFDFEGDWTYQPSLTLPMKTALKDAA